MTKDTSIHGPGRYAVTTYPEGAAVIDKQDGNKIVASGALAAMRQECIRLNKEEN